MLFLVQVVGALVPTITSRRLPKGAEVRLRAAKLPQILVKHPSTNEEKNSSSSSSLNSNSSSNNNSPSQHRRPLSIATWAQYPRVAGDNS